MIVRKFLAWAQTASAGARAEGASALARAFLFSGMEAAEKREAEVALTALLDDPSPLVRRALAEALAASPAAPRHCIAVLANDQSDIASLVLARSPVLTDAELIDCAAVGDAFAQAAIALRACVPAPVAAALAEVGGRDALVALAGNPGATLPDFSLRRMIERHGDDADVREAILARPGLPPALRAELVAATARALSAFVTACDWMSEARASRVAREETEKAAVIIAADVEDDAFSGPLALVGYLRESGSLTPGLVLRALLSGNRSLFEAALTDLSGMPAHRVAGLVNGGRGAGFRALYLKAGLPKSLLPAFEAALAAQDELGLALERGDQARLSRVMIERVLTACERMHSTELGKLLALLRRFEAEAAREDARVDTREMLEREIARTGFDAAPAALIDHAIARAA